MKRRVRSELSLGTVVALGLAAVPAQAACFGLFDSLIGGHSQAKAQPSSDTAPDPLILASARRIFESGDSAALRSEIQQIAGSADWKSAYLAGAPILVKAIANLDGATTVRVVEELRRLSRSLDVTPEEMKPVFSSIGSTLNGMDLGSETRVELVRSLVLPWGEVPARFRPREDPENEADQANWRNMRFPDQRTLFGDALFSYEGLFGRHVIEDWIQLRSDQILLEVGPGEFNALHDYFFSDHPALVERRARGPLGQVIAVSKSTPRDPSRWQTIEREFPEFFTKHLGIAVEDLSTEAIPLVDRILDGYAAGSYSRRLDQVFNRYLGWLKPGGKAAIRLSTRATRIYLRGVEVAIEDWLSLCRGFGWHVRMRPVDWNARAIDLQAPEGEYFVHPLVNTWYRISGPESGRRFEIAPLEL